MSTCGRCRKMKPDTELTYVRFYQRNFVDDFCICSCCEESIRKFLSGEQMFHEMPRHKCRFCGAVDVK